jgi:hypothetical protein
LVNGIIEKQKREKMVAGDTIEMNGEIFRLKLSANQQGHAKKRKMLNKIKVGQRDSERAVFDGQNERSIFYSRRSLFKFSSKPTD